MLAGSVRGDLVQWHLVISDTGSPYHFVPRLHSLLPPLLSPDQLSHWSWYPKEVKRGAFSTEPFTIGPSGEPGRIFEQNYHFGSAERNWSLLLSRSYSLFLSTIFFPASCWQNMKLSLSLFCLKKFGTKKSAPDGIWLDSTEAGKCG